MGIHRIRMYVCMYVYECAIVLFACMYVLCICILMCNAVIRSIIMWFVNVPGIYCGD